jgi:hypothetical protein
MVGRRIAVPLALAMLLMIPGAALGKPAKRYVLRHPARELCRAHYTRRITTVVKRVHGHRVRVPLTICVRKGSRHHRPGTTPQPHGLPPGTKPGVTLHDRLDPSFKQSPTNPLAVTYSFSASASESVNGSERSTSLPAGFLNLYSDGLLACSINVGGSVTGGECPVTYGGFGAHKVVVIYDADSLDTTETAVEQIKPFTTRTTLKLSGPTSCSNSEETEKCSYVAEVASVDQNGNVPPQGGERIAFNELPEQEFTPGIFPAKIGEPEGAFTGPVNFTLERTHNTKEGWWACALQGPGFTEYFGGPVTWRISVECGTSVSVYGDYSDFPGELWTRSASEATPVHF